MATLLTLMTLEAGGPGSGCFGPTCGRPKGFDETLYEHGWRPMHVEVFPNTFENGNYRGQHIEVRNDGRWRHSSFGEGLKRGRSLEDLKDWLVSWHHMTGDRGGKLVEEMPMRYRAVATEGDALAEMIPEHPTSFSPTKGVYAGGPGSGCHGANCGRPITGKTFKMMRGKLKSMGVPIKRNASPWDVVKTYDAWFRGAKTRAQVAKTAKQGVKRARARIQKAIQKGKLPKIGKTTPGLVTDKGKQHIDIQPVWKGRVKQSYVAQGGHQVTELKTPKQYEKNKGTWVNKPSLYKGQFLVDLAEHRTYNDPKERNSFFIHQAAPDKGVSVEVHRNLGSLSVNVIERKLGQYGAIEDHREVSFKNVGRAAGFLNRRYGITFRLGGSTK